MRLVEGVVHVGEGAEEARDGGEDPDHRDDTDHRDDPDHRDDTDHRDERPGGDPGDDRLPSLDAFVDRLDELREAHGGTVQAFDARYVVGRSHVERAVELADRASERGESIARDHAVEVLLWAAGRRQIDRALEMGVGAGETPVVAVVDGGDEDDAVSALRDLLQPAQTLGAYDEDRIRSFFDITERELAATDAGLESLVLERVALLTVEK